MSRIRVHIDRLVLPGLEIRERKALVEGLRGELTRALSDPAARAEWARSHRAPLLKLTGMPLTSGRLGARKFGANLGDAIGKGLKP